MSDSFQLWLMGLISGFGLGLVVTAPFWLPAVMP